jgi:hypothetical protein
MSPFEDDVRTMTLPTANADVFLTNMNAFSEYFVFESEENLSSLSSLPAEEKEVSL